MVLGKYIGERFEKKKPLTTFIPSEQKSRLMKLAFILSLLVLSFLAPVHAMADFEKGRVAANAEDFEIAYNEWKPLTEDGDSGAGYRWNYWRSI